MPVRRSLAVGAADDPAEREADQIADRVMRSLRSAPSAKGAPVEETRIAPMSRSMVSRAGGVPDDEVDLDDLDAQNETAQQTTDETEEATTSGLAAEVTAGTGGVSRIRRSAAGTDQAIGAQGGALNADTTSRIERARGSGSTLDAGTRASMESAFGTDFSNVRVHEGRESSDLNSAMGARAFTTGSDIFFGAGTYQPGSADGQRLLAHELTHVVQQSAPSSPAAARRVVRRKFDVAGVNSNAHLRAKGVWGTFVGPKISKGDSVLVNESAPEVKVNKVTRNTTWVPAVSLPLDHQGAIPADRVGYIRKKRVSVEDGALDFVYQAWVGQLLGKAEKIYAGTMDGLLRKQKHIDFLVAKGLREPTWNTDTTAPSAFAAGFGSVQDRFDRIEVGAKYVADGLDYWRRWLCPENPAGVTIADVSFVESDLHEHGLGVIRAKFTKPAGRGPAKFKDQTNVEVMIKPEDKSLEQRLLGDDDTSAANQINQIVGLTDPDEMLTTIKMQSTVDHGSLVELVQGTAAENLASKGDNPIKQTFHETLVFAFLAGIDDLHKENVFWHEGRPYMIDADNVLSRNQMKNVDNGDLDQGGMSSWNKDEATANRGAIKAKTNPMNSKILDAMINDAGKRVAIGKVLRASISGGTGRVVPIRTNKWAGLLKGYMTASDGERDTVLDKYSSNRHLVREAEGFNKDIGPGLHGVTGTNRASAFFDQAAEKAETKKDFEAGVIPFYEYTFDTGHVTHNGVKIFHGLSVDDAIGELMDYFDSTGASRQSVIA